MTKEEMIWIATWAWYKDLDYETLCYCDYMNGRARSRLRYDRAVELFLNGKAVNEIAEVIGIHT